MGARHWEVKLLLPLSSNILNLGKMVCRAWHATFGGDRMVMIGLST